MQHAVKPTRVYVHETLFTDAYDSSVNLPQTYIDLNKPDFIGKIFEQYTELFEPDDFLIMALWGNDGKQIAEVFGYFGTNPWPGNPEVNSWVFSDGIYQREQRQICCADTLIVLGREEEARRKAPDLKSYMQNPPDVRDLMKSLDDHR
ncbi:MAG: hypothetical protein HYU56_02330 [Candidatus Aenigmarchaeota archaeon]|nr:hypothetical protein [Candidatus Aenigmarchaeota archaeon]